MKIYSLLAALSLFACLSEPLFAQKIKLTQGDLSPLKGQTSVNLEFTYDNMSVGKFPKEADYVVKKKEEYNSKEAGKGDTWAKNWIDDRQARFEPKFIEKFESESGMKVDRNKSAKYTIIFNTSFTEPGFNIGVAKKNAYISGEFVIVETSDKNKIVAKISMEKAPGRTFMGFADFDTGERLSESYEVAGKRIGKFVSK